MPLEDEDNSKQLERAFRRRKHQLQARRPVLLGRVTPDVRRHGDPRVGRDVRGRAAAGRGRSRPGLVGQPRATRRPASPWTAGSSSVDEYCQHQRVANVYAVGDLIPTHPAAGPRRLRRGHHGRRAHRRRSRSCRSTTPASRGSPTPARGRVRRLHRGFRPVEKFGADQRQHVVTYDLSGNGRSADPEHQGRGQAGRRRRTGRCSACTSSAIASASSIAEAQLIYNWEALPEEVASPDPSAPDAVRGDRRGAPAVGRQAVARAQLTPPDGRPSTTEKFHE